MPSPRDFVDLHSHSTASDGTLEPAAVVQLAVKNGLSALSLTDHDTIAGIAPAQAEAARLGLDFLPGIEISAQFPHPGTLHLLGYGVDPNSACLTEMTRSLRAGRDDRNPKIIARLRELHVDISMEEVEKQAGGDVIGRPHIAAILLRKGYVSSIKQAFDKYLAPGGVAYFDKERLEPSRALEMIHESGGLPVLAHPVQLCTQNDAELERIVKDLIDLGLAGIEVIHSDHTPPLVEKYGALADKLHLLRTGGSDFHGDNKSGIVLGKAQTRGIPRAYYDGLMERLGQKKTGFTAKTQRTQRKA
jgi:predicted metal-dependent phosphoesterase TrpH